MGDFVREDRRRGSNYYGSEHGAPASVRISAVARGTFPSDTANHIHHSDCFATHKQSGLLPYPEGSQGRSPDTTAGSDRAQPGGHRRRDSQSSQYSLHRTRTQDSLAEYFGSQRRPSESARNRAASPVLHRRGMSAHRGVKQTGGGTRSNDTEQGEPPRPRCCAARP